MTALKRIILASLLMVPLGSTSATAIDQSECAYVSSYLLIQARNEISQRYDGRLMQVFYEDTFCIFDDSRNEDIIGYHATAAARIPIRDCGNPDLRYCISGFFVFALPASPVDLDSEWQAEDFYFSMVGAGTVELLGHSVHVEYIQSRPIERERGNGLLFLYNRKLGIVGFGWTVSEESESGTGPFSILSSDQGVGSEAELNK
jgi:hypothetical protein